MQVRCGSIRNICLAWRRKDKNHATQTDEGVVEAGAEVCPLPIQENAAGNVYNIADLNNYDFLMKFYTVTSITSLTTQIMRPEEFLAKDLSLEKMRILRRFLYFIHIHRRDLWIRLKEIRLQQ